MSKVFLTSLLSLSMPRPIVLLLTTTVVTVLLSMGQAAPRRYTHTVQYDLNLRSIKRIFINTYVGDVRIANSPDGFASLEAVRYARDNHRLVDAVVLVDPVGEDLMITARDASDDIRSFNDSGVNFELLLPKSVEFRVFTGEGNISVEGARGRFGIRSDRGSLSLKNINDASIDAVLARGAIELSNVQFAIGSSSRVITRFGTAKISGLRFYPNAQLRLETGVGTISCYLPGFAATKNLWQRKGPGKLTALKVQTGLGNISVQP